MLLLLKGQGAEIGGIMLDGHVTVPGVRSLQADPTVKALVSDPAVFKDNPYLLLAALQTTNEVTRSRNFVPVDLSLL